MPAYPLAIGMWQGMQGLHYDSSVDATGVYSNIMFTGVVRGWTEGHTVRHYWWLPSL